MPFIRHPSMAARRAIRGVKRTPFWLDREDRPEPTPALTSDRDADLVIVGAGLTGLWAGLAALEENPGRDVVLLDGGTAGWVVRTGKKLTGSNHMNCDHSLIRRPIWAACGSAGE
jgi:hypothetical protein